jgi:hypothetical protein
MATLIPIFCHGLHSSLTILYDSPMYLLSCFQRFQRRRPGSQCYLHVIYPALPAFRAGMYKSTLAISTQCNNHTRVLPHAYSKSCPTMLIVATAGPCPKHPDHPYLRSASTTFRSTPRFHNSTVELATLSHPHRRLRRPPPGILVLLC